MTQSYWQILLEALGGFAILVAALTWLVKQVISHFLKKDIEAFKNRLAADADREIERLKTELSTAAKRKEVQFTKLQEKRAEVIADLYYQLEDTMLWVSMFQRIAILHREGRLDEEKFRQRMDAVVERQNKLHEFFRRNQLYLSNSLATRISEAIFALPGVAVVSVYLERRAQNEDEFQKAQLSLIESWEKQGQSAHDILKLIANEFRALLGSTVDL